MKSITAPSSVNDPRHNSHHYYPQQPASVHRETGAFQLEKEFLPSPQLGPWTREEQHDYKRLLPPGHDDNAFYPVRPQAASIKSTSFVGADGSYDKSKKFINSNEFHSLGAAGNHLSHSESQLNKLYPKFNDFSPGENGMGGPPMEIPHYVPREEHHFHNTRPVQQLSQSVSVQAMNTPTSVLADVGRPEIRVQPLQGGVSSSTAFLGGVNNKHTSFIHSAATPPDHHHHPYTFDFGHGESAALAKPALELYDLNEYERYPPLEIHHHEKHIKFREAHPMVHGPRSGPPIR